MNTQWAMAGAELNYHFINSSILTLLVSLFVLWRYRRAVLDGMMHGDTATLPLPSAMRSDRVGLKTDLATLLRYEQSLGRRIAVAYWLTTLSCSIPLAAGYAYLSGWEPSTVQVLMLGLCYSFVCAPMIIVSLAIPPARAITAVVQFALLLTALAVGMALIQRVLGGRPIGLQHFKLVPLFIEMAAIQLWLPAFFWLLTWPSRVRGFAPITFSALVVFGLAPFIGSRLTDSLAATEAGTPWAYSLGQNGLFLLIGFPVSWLAWRRLQRLSRDYEAKRFSDAQLLSRTWWLFLIVSVGGELVIARRQSVAALLLCSFVLFVFPPINRFWLAQLRAGMQLPPPRTLLLLRVFGYTARTERLFDRIGARWRLFGPVTMIAAPDVAARTIDPGDYLLWLTGRIGKLFITSRTALDAKLAALDTRPDPDGRYRVNEFCCGNNAWQATVVELMDRADAVVMDLRGLTRDRRGCGFELQQLAERLPPERIVLVTDHATDHTVLESGLGQKLREVHVAKVEGTRDIETAFTALLEAAR